MATPFIYTSEGKSIDQKKGLMKDISAAVCKNIGQSPETVDCKIFEVSDENRSIACTTILIYTSEGKSIDQKRGLVKDINAAVCKNFGESPEAVNCKIFETGDENKSRAGKLGG